MKRVGEDCRGKLDEKVCEAVQEVQHEGREDLKGLDQKGACCEAEDQEVGERQLRRELGEKPVVGASHTRRPFLYTVT